MNKIIGTAVLSMILLGAGVAAAQTSTMPGGNPNQPQNQPGQQNAAPGGSPVNPGAMPQNFRTPGAPNTGAGGDATANIALLSLSAIAAVGGLVYLARKRTN